MIVLIYIHAHIHSYIHSYIHTYLYKFMFGSCQEMIKTGRLFDDDTTFLPRYFGYYMKHIDIKGTRGSPLEILRGRLPTQKNKLGSGFTSCLLLLSLTSNASVLPSLGIIQVFLQLIHALELNKDRK